MGALRILSARPELRLLAVALLLAAAVTALVLATTAPLVAAALALGVAVAAALVGAGVPPAQRSARPAPLPEPAPALHLTLPNGATLSARPVALPGDAEHQLLLTRDGYVVVDAEGRLIHKL